MLLSNGLIESKIYESTSHRFYLSNQLEHRLFAVLYDPVNVNIKELLQSAELIQMIKSNCDSMYESSLDACSHISKIMENTDMISLGVSIAAEVYFLLCYYFVVDIGCVVVGNGVRIFRIVKSL